MRLTCFMRFPRFCRIYSRSSDGRSTNRLRQLSRKMKPTSSRKRPFFFFLFFSQPSKFNCRRFFSSSSSSSLSKETKREEDDHDARVNVITTPAAIRVEYLSRGVETIFGENSVKLRGRDRFHRVAAARWYLCFQLPLSFLPFS